MPNFAQDVLAIGAGGFNSTDPTVAGSPLLNLGLRVKAKDGRVFRWCLCGATSTVAGSLYQTAAQGTNFQNMACTVTAIGGTVVNVTPGASTATANQFAEGNLIIHAATGIGYNYAVSSHPAVTSSTAFNVTLRADDAIQIALDATSKADLVANLYSNVVVGPTTVTGAMVGWATYIITNAQNGWLQTWGTVGGLVNGTPAVGQAVIPSATTAGAVDIFSSTAQIVGYMMVTGVSTKVQPIFAQIGA